MGETLFSKEYWEGYKLAISGIGKITINKNSILIRELLPIENGDASSNGFNGMQLGYKIRLKSIWECNEPALFDITGECEGELINIEDTSIAFIQFYLPKSIQARISKSNLEWIFEAIKIYNTGEGYKAEINTEVMDMLINGMNELVYGEEELKIIINLTFKGPDDM